MKPILHRLPPLLALAFAAALPLTAAAQGDGNVVKATVTMLPDGRQKNTVVDPEKRTTEETILNNKGKLLSRTVYDMDERGQTVGATFFDAAGKALYKATYKHDAADRIAEENYVSLAGKPMGRRVYTYGLNNKVTQIDTYDPDGNLVVPQKPAGAARPDKKKR